MARRTKAELTQANYYEWLKVCNELRAKKKSGVKLTSEEKVLLRTVPSPEAPYSSSPRSDVPKRKPTAKKVKIDFDKNVVWPSTARSFLCAVYNVPYGDEQCLLFCEREDCPFYQVGYFRAHGVKY
jgi:hypothetical protein